MSDYKKNKTKIMKRYDALLDREIDFTDWLEDKGETELKDEYDDKAEEFWNDFSVEDGDEVLDKIEALLDEYEARANYTRRESSDGDDEEDGDEDYVTYANRPDVGAQKSTARKSQSAGCIFPLVIAVLIITALLLFITEHVTAGIAVAASVFVFAFAFFIGMFVHEHHIFSTKIDPSKYEYRDGVVEDCYCSSTTRVNSRTYKTFVITLNADGKIVTAYARKEHRVGDTVHLAVRKDKLTAKLVDESGKALYRYNYEYYSTPDTYTSSRPVTPPTDSTQKPTGSSYTSGGSYKRPSVTPPVPPVSPRTELVLDIPEEKEEPLIIHAETKEETKDERPETDTAQTVAAKPSDEIIQETPSIAPTQSRTSSSASSRRIGYKPTKKG
ncbi:MAG: hypothetical protein J1G04_04275 [Clostridiales bacterium]|nr:hypothetical protein [Clostridiales bacterium]